MTGFSNPRRSLEAGALALLAVLALHAPPLHVLQRADLALFDLWTRSSWVSPSSAIVLVDVEDGAALEEVAALAKHDAARLVVTTLPKPPSADLDGFVLGPVDIPIDARRLRRTEWRHGGHLAFETDLDGRVRRDHALAESGVATPSLAAYAARELSPSHSVGDDGSRWPRFSPGSPFSTSSLEELRSQHGDLRDRIVIAGPFLGQHATPVGTLTTPELVAQVVASYVDNRRIDAGLLGSAAAWIVAVVLLTLLSLRTPAARGGVVAAGASACAALLAWGWGSFALGALWVPVAGPAAWLAGTCAILAWRQHARPRTITHETDLVAARKAVADGNLAQAWSLYRQVAPASTLVPELYDLACALETGGAEREAADLFHRIAQIDGSFRDVAKRLVRCSHGNQGASAMDVGNMPGAMGRYELLEPIARGATGYVYLGRDPKINRIVALKVIDLAAEFEPEELETESRNFLREAEIAGRLSHPNIVTIFDVGESLGLAYIAMEYLKGKHLSEFATPDRLLPVSRVLELLSRTADALDYAHGQNVVHRDIKPANIMYDSISDGLKITDFGIARLIDVGRTRTGIVLGTPAFMSPEQLEGKNVNGHTDLFALGVSLYQLLTGQLPFRGASMTKLMFVIANEPHESVTTVRPDLPACLDPIVDRALAKDPADRFQTGAEMAAALRHGAAQLA